MMDTFGYIRTARRGEEVEASRMRQYDAIQARTGHTLHPDLIFIDEGESGTTPLQDRPQGAKLVEALEMCRDAGEPATLIVWSLDRLSRNVAETVDLLRFSGKLQLVVCEVQPNPVPLNDPPCDPRSVTVFGYVRTAERDMANRNGIPQFDAIQAFAAKRFGELLDSAFIFEDRGVSPTTPLLERHDGALLLGEIARNQGDPDEIPPVHLVVWSASVLTRNLSVLADLMTELAAFNVQLHVLKPQPRSFDLKSLPVQFLVEAMNFVTMFGEFRLEDE